ncbi:MAG: phosphoribosylglycinamide formyltransferase [Firmicutes bacterium]|nr:phosphoribosylglycinamide formyltransferase [Bacillota bacterium]
MGRLAVLISGRGSNLQALIDAIAAGKLDAEIVTVISDRSDALGLDRARRAGIPTQVLPWLGEARRDEYFQNLQMILEEADVELVVLAGFMRLLPKELVRAFPQRIINIHPSLLPAFPGLNAQRQALDYGVKIAGCTVHFVDEGMDSGPIIVQKAVPVYDYDTEESLAERILAKEHEALPQAVALVLSKQWQIRGRKVVCKC